MKNKDMNSGAVSEVIGAVLMIGLVVIGGTIVGAVYFSQPAPKAIPHLSFNVEYQDDTHVAILRHTGGDSLIPGEYNLYIINSTGQYLIPNISKPWSFGQEYPPISTMEKPGTVLLTYTDGQGETMIHRVVYDETVGGGSPAGPDDWTISGHKWDESTGAGLDGWTFELQVPQGSAWSVLKTDISKDGGAYRFDGLSPGTYRVRERAQSRWIQVEGNLTPITLSDALRFKRDVDFTNQYQPEHETVDWSIDGYKIDAATGAGVPDWTILLQYKDRNDWTQWGTATTDESGYYHFPNLDNDQYRINEQMENDWHFVSAKMTKDGEISTYSSLSSLMNTVITINGGHRSARVNFTNAENVTLPLDGTVSGMVWSDDDTDGIWDEERESVIENWEIFLTPQDGGVSLDPVRSDASGHYTFTGVTAGTYVISEQPRTGWIQTFPSSPGTYSVTIDKNQLVHEERDFGNLNTVPPVDGAISGLKFNDLNGDGDRDAGEPALQGWEIVLYSQITPPLELSRDITNESGQYEFLDLAAGTYYIGEVQKSGWNQTCPNSTAAPEVSRYFYTKIIDASVPIYTNLDFGNHVYVPPPPPTPAPTPQEWEGQVVHLIKLAGGSGKLVDGTYFQCETSNNDYVVIDGTRHTFDKDQVRFIINGNQTRGRLTITDFDLIEFSFNVIMQVKTGDTWEEVDRGMISDVRIRQINKNGISAASTLRYELTSVSADTTLDINGENVIDSPNDASPIEVWNCHIVHDNRYHEGNNVMYLHLEPNQNSLLVQCDTIVSPPPG